MRLQVAPQVRWIVAFLFAIHPIQAESIAWVAGFSTPFYVLFSLLSILFYLRYAHTPLPAEEGQGEGLSVEMSHRVQYYAIALGLFILAGLAKSAAVALPPTLIILDWWRRPEHLTLQRRILGYIPFFAVALVFGLVTIHARNASGTSVGAASNFDMVERLLMICYTPLLYIGKMLVPLRLNVYYSFNQVNGAFPWYYYAAPVVLIAIAVFAWIKRHSAPYIWIGLLFYLANIFVTLPFATLGEFELCADHYNYLACVGIFWILARGWQALQAQWPNQASVLRIVGIVWLVAVTLLGFWQVRTWKDTITVISNAIDNGFYHNGMMYFGRGIEYGDLKKPELAIKDFTEAIKLDSNKQDAYKFRGSLYAQTGRLDLALPDLEKYVQFRPDDAVTWNNLYEIYFRLNRFDDALRAIDNTIELKPGVPGSYQKRAMLYNKLNQPEKANADLGRAADLMQRKGQ
jgi:protein O-mannosyl-transferase